ncbi:peptidase S8/S53 domain-containing protein [Lophiotrema nucula]|uniref:Peptidase S8/S53 domain-containing protein n=1 Tax=Lophiotrema nucula TaxID=690887 RepID=A0A6A5ZLP9_9PLEO|nr:peptidase S8/S53 domain-containing protein [Lophiotrema nucula]
MRFQDILSLGSMLSVAIAAPALPASLSDAAKKRLNTVPKEIRTVPDEYCVHFEGNYTLSQHLSYLNLSGNTTNARFEPLKYLNAYFGYFGDDMLHKVLEDPGVKLVEMNDIGWIPDPDHGIRYGNVSNDDGSPRNSSNSKRADHIPPQTNAPWHLHQLSEKFKGEPGNEFRMYGNALGENVDIYIVDSGIQKTAAGYIVDGKGVVTVKDFSGHEDPSDHVGHGTGVAALAAGATVGVAKEATIISAKVCHTFDGCSAFNTVKALEWILEREGKKPKDKQGKAVVNMSIQNGVIRHDLASLISKGYGELNLIFFAAAGNIPTGSKPNAEDNYPCGYDLVNCVGATKRNYDRWEGSSKGEKVLFVAPGELVKTAWPVDEDDPKKGQTYELRRGTSFSSPLAAGVAAMFISHECFITPAQPFARLEQNGVKGISKGWSKKSDKNKIFVNTGYWKGGNEGDPYFMPKLLGGHC